MKGTTAQVLRRLPWLAPLLFALPAQALDYRSVEPASAVFYDAPAASARKLFVVSRFYPVEVVVSLADWIKVRDVTGALAWVSSTGPSAQPGPHGRRAASPVLHEQPPRQPALDPRQLKNARPRTWTACWRAWWRRTPSR